MKIEEKKIDYQKLKLKKFRPKLRKPMISINQRGFRFNLACEKYMNRHYKYCELYYDNDEKVIAIRPTNVFSGNLMKVDRTLSNPFVRAMNFLNITGIRKALKLSANYKSIRMLPIWNNRAKAFLLDLKPFVK